jgi:hypothetical protein
MLRLSRVSFFKDPQAISCKFEISVLDRTELGLSNFHRVLPLSADYRRRLFRET